MKTRKFHRTVASKFDAGLPERERLLASAAARQTVRLRTMADMTPAELAAIAAHYGVKLSTKPPKRRSRRVPRVE